MVSKLSLSVLADARSMLSRTMRAMMSLSLEAGLACLERIISVALLRMMLRASCMSRFILAGRYLVMGMKAASPWSTRDQMSNAKTKRYASRIGISGCSSELRSVPNPASPIMSRVVRFSHSRTSNDFVLVLSRSISRCHSFDRSSAFCQKTGVRVLIEDIENPDASAFR